MSRALRRLVAATDPASLGRRHGIALEGLRHAAVEQTRPRDGARAEPSADEVGSSPEFAAATMAKSRTPFEDAVATLRILGVQPPASGTMPLRELTWSVAGLGQAPLRWPAPNGYRRGGRVGRGARARWPAGTPTSTRPAAGTEGPGPEPPSALLPATLPTTHGALVDALAARLLIAPLTAGQKAAVCAFVDATPAKALRSTDAALTWRLPYLVALLLDSPHFATR